MNDDGIETKPSSRDTEPRRHLGEPEVSRAFGTAEQLSTAPDMMGYVPAATGASAESKRTRHVEKSSQEII